MFVSPDIRRQLLLSDLFLRQDVRADLASQWLAESHKKLTLLFYSHPPPPIKGCQLAGKLGLTSDSALPYGTANAANSAQ
jgi:hypothetical protein